MFGMKDDPVSEACGWGSSASCGPSEDPSTKEVYEGMVKAIENSPLADQTVTKFVDLADDEADNYPKELEFIDKGYQLPITFINGKASFSGKVDEVRLIEYIERAKTEQ